ncbi:hypothetical protein Cgig2_004645 [Carnegiea gigantea]|uniref:Uncharacterized protein n=1 Tax=Carnegiea gigantea TaxID=171969 RepID=A0A9Q1K6H3_9CARY|nr:hypothetical protein Cgig2_004645 [Carnegiea gigantea]
MTSTATPLFYPHPRFSIPYWQHQMWQCRPRRFPILSLSFSHRHRHRRRRPTRRNPIRNDPSQSSSSDSSRLQFVLDLGELKSKAPISILQRTLSLCESKFDQFISAGTEACRDLQALVTIEPGSNRVVVSCSESTVRFVGGVVLWSCLAVVVIRVFGNVGLGFRRRNGIGKVEVVRRRDRSLGGREVVVASRLVEGERERSDLGSVHRDWKALRKGLKRREERKLPSWWPVTLPRPVVEHIPVTCSAHEVPHAAIMDAKLIGKDVSEDDILEQLRKICRNSGVRLSIGAENARDSLYRSSAHYVINTCCMSGSHAQIGGEDPRLFLTGLAHDLGITAPRAATIVCAAVAARTRLWFLQAWASEMQSKHSEATEELKKICLIHKIFPPEPSSIVFVQPEMDMVASCLQKHLNLKDREFLLKKLIGVCGEESRRSAAEALGLV